MALQDTSTYDDYRALIYYRQSVVARWLHNGNKVIPCLRHRVPNKTAIDVVQRGVHAKYSGLQVCGRLWLCPACASKAARERRKGMQRAIDAERRAGSQLAFVTYTVRHKSDDALAEVAGWVLNAHRKMHSGKAWQNIEAAYDWRGSIKAVEVLYGSNGWHFHLHELGFIGSNSSIDDLQADLRSKWLGNLHSVGADADRDIGLTCKVAQQSVRDYVTKWGIVPELASGADKKARRGGVLPFQFPDTLLGGSSGKVSYRELFCEYSEATRGIKQIWASPTIRPYMAKADEVRGERGDQVSELLASLTIDQWRTIRNRGLRAELLRQAEAGNLTDWLNSVNVLS